MYTYIRATTEKMQMETISCAAALESEERKPQLWRVLRQRYVTRSSRSNPISTASPFTFLPLRAFT